MRAGREPDRRRCRSTINAGEMVVGVVIQLALEFCDRLHGKCPVLDGPKRPQSGPADPGDPETPYARPFE